MAPPSFASAWKSFWHAMTSEDRHASHDSPYKNAQRVPNSSNRHAPLNSISNGIDTQPEFSPYIDNPVNRPNSSGFRQSNGSPAVGTPTSPYSPGMRSMSAAGQRPDSREHNPFDAVKPGEIQMQSFQNGQAPAPPIMHSWGRIDRWAENHYEELYDQLSEGATNNDLNELEHTLDCSLPMEVRESLQHHDGQERGGRPTGIIFSSMLLDCEEIAQEWQNWKKVNSEYLAEPARQSFRSPVKTFSGSSASSSTSQPPESQSSNAHWRQDLLSNQDSQPSGAIQKVYAHPSWIPLVRDWGGNNIAVDLAPGPTGTWGQVILFGRDYDCKYVIARSWSAFLAMVADDLSSEKWWVEEESGDLKLKEFKTNTVEPGYLDILRWRMDQKYGRKGPKRKNGGASSPQRQPGLSRISTNVDRINGSASASASSPYASPTFDEPGSPRNRSPQRYGSPKPGFGRPSPLSSQVTDSSPNGNPAPKPRQHSIGIKSPDPVRPLQSSKLVEVATPRQSEDGIAPTATAAGHAKKLSLGHGMVSIGLDGTADEQGGAVKGLGVEGLGVTAAVDDK